MKVSAKSWHGRVYLWWATHRKNWSRWARHRLSPPLPPPPRLNLCHYVRVILFFAPLYWLAYTRSRRWPWLRPWEPVALVAAVAALVGCWMRWPTGTKEVLLAMAVGLGAVVGFILVMAAVAFAGVTVQEWWGDRRLGKIGKPPRTDPTFRQVTWSWVKAKKSRICPFIDIVEEP